MEEAFTDRRSMKFFYWSRYGIVTQPNEFRKCCDVDDVTVAVLTGNIKSIRAHIYYLKFVHVLRKEN